MTPAWSDKPRGNNTGPNNPWSSNSWSNNPWSNNPRTDTSRSETSESDQASADSSGGSPYARAVDSSPTQVPIDAPNPPYQTPAPTNALQSLCLQASTSLIYALIDPAQDPQWQLSTDELEEATRAGLVIANPFIDLPPWQRPYLKRVDVRQEELGEMVERQRSRLPRQRTESSPFCAWITTPVMTVMQSHGLGRKQTVTSPEGKSCLLRYFDPRVMQLLDSLLEPGQKMQLLIPFHSWFYFDHQHLLRELVVPKEQRPASGFSLSPGQWSALKRSGRINHLIDKWRALAPDRMAEAPPERINALLQLADHYAIQAPADQDRFALHGLHLGDAFHRHPTMQRLIHSVSPTHRYGDLARSLSSSDWNDISTWTRSTDRGQ